MDDDNSNLYLSLEHAEDEMEDEDDFQQRQIAVLGALVFVGAEESRRERLARRQARRDPGLTTISIPCLMSNRRLLMPLHKPSHFELHLETISTTFSIGTLMFHSGNLVI